MKQKLVCISSVSNKAPKTRFSLHSVANLVEQPEIWGIPTQIIEQLDEC
jgi:hypothetical protein